MAEQKPRLLSSQPEVHVLSPFLELCSFTSCLLTACSILGTDAKMIRHAGDSLGGLPGKGKKEGAGEPRKKLWISRQT